MTLRPIRISLRIVIPVIVIALIVGVTWGKFLEKSKFLTKQKFAALLKPLLKEDQLLFHDNKIMIPGYDGPVTLEYSVDPTLQLQVEDMFDAYKPDYGALVAIDADTGRVLASVSYNKAFKEMQGSPVLQATFPAASVFKVITAAAVIEEEKLTPESLIPYSGRDHTLYRDQVLNPEVRGWIRVSTLKNAFAHSINTVFGRLGVFHLGRDPLISYSSKFGFNREIPSEFPVEASHVADVTDRWELAEVASGFTKDTTMSPLHGAMIAAAVVNDGKMMEPYFIQSAMLESGELIYRAEPKVFSTPISKDTASELQHLMNETVLNGTGRKSFRGFFRGTYRELNVGGKTGSLTSADPDGKVDWFVGFAKAQGRKIAISVMTVHQKYWVVKSSYLARKTFEKAFGNSTTSMN